MSCLRHVIAVFVDMRRSICEGRACAESNTGAMRALPAAHMRGWRMAVVLNEHILGFFSRIFQCLVERRMST